MKVRNTWSFKRELLTMYYAFRQPGTPWYAKLSALLSIIYLLSPADLVPDMIPFAGWIDDLLVVPFLINIATRLLPGEIRSVSAEKARRSSRRANLILLLIGIVVIGIMVLLFLFISRWLQAGGQTS